MRITLLTAAKSDYSPLNEKITVLVIMRSVPTFKSILKKQARDSILTIYKQ